MLYIVPTPIGNLEDITLRALETLKNVDIIASEDTRHSKILLKKYGIQTPLISFHQGTNPEKIISLLENGKNVALVSDAGTPCISDPGLRLVSAVRKKDLEVSALPGASAFLTALSASGMDTAHFEFFGFMPHKKGRQTLLKKIAKLSHTAIFYESTHRIMKFLKEAQEFLPKKKICLARELTKIHEEYLYGTAKELFELLSLQKEKQKGEFVVLIEN